MEKFMFLFRGGEIQANNPVDSQIARDNMQLWINWMQELTQNGAYLGGDPLKPEGKQVNGRSKVVSDGPFVESKEIVGGYIIVNAKSIDEAVELSKGCPIFTEDGKVEIRQIQNMDV